MTLKITLITPPDIFQNDNESFMFVNITEQEQNESSEWLGRFDSDQHINVYFQQDEADVPWFLHALSSSKYKYINIDNISGITTWLAGYVLGKPNTYYKCSDPNVASLYSHINSCRVNSITDFFERTLSGK